MKQIWVIGKKELLAAAINPASLLAVIIFFTAATVPFFFLQPFFVLGRGSTGLSSFFAFFPYLCAFIVPVFTMNSGIESAVYFSLPITVTQTVAAKWFAALFCLSVCLISTTVVPIIASFFGAVDAALVVTAYLGLFCFNAAGCAAGVLFSFAFKNYLVSYLLTALALLATSGAHLVPQYLNIPPIFASLVNYFSFSWHFDSFSKGIIDTRDMVFFAVCTAFFLGLTVFQAEKKRFTSKSSHKVLKRQHLEKFYYLFFLLCLLLAANSQRFYARFDLSRNKIFSVSDQSAQILQKIPDNLRITYYLSDKLKNLYPQTRDITDFLRKYADSGKKVVFSVIDPQKSGLEKTLDSIGILPQQIQSSEQNQTSFLTVYSAIVLEYGGQTAQIPFILSTAGLEYDLNIRVQRLAEGIIRRVYVLFGGAEPVESFKYVIPWLESSGFFCIPALASDLPELNAAVPLLVIGSANLVSRDIFEIERFVLEGGSAAFAVSNYTINLADWSADPSEDDELPALLDFWGFTVGRQFVLDPVNYRIRMQGADGDNRFEYVNYPFWVRVLPQNAEKNLLTAAFYGMQMYWPNPLFIADDKNIQPILKTSPEAWLLEPASEAPFFVTDPFAVQKNDGKTRGQYTLAAAAQKTFLPYYGVFPAEKPLRAASRLAVIANQYFCSTMIEYTESPQNIDFLANVLLWLSYEDSLLELRSKGEISDSLSRITSAQQLAAAKVKTALALCAIPFAAAIVFALFMFKRSRTA